MTNEQILKKAIEKATNNGKYNWDYWVGSRAQIKEMIKVGYYYRVIFSHDFAKAFWGSDNTEIPIEELASSIQSAWAYHLTKMVLEKEPLKYIEKFLK